MLLTETVVQNRIEKSLGFSRARTCGDDGWFGFFTLGGKSDPGVYLMIVGCPVRFYGQRNLINCPLFRFYKWQFERHIRTLEHSQSGMFDKLIKCSGHLPFPEGECRLQV